MIYEEQNTHFQNVAARFLRHNNFANTIGASSHCRLATTGFFLRTFLIVYYGSVANLPFHVEYLIAFLQTEIVL